MLNILKRQLMQPRSGAIAVMAAFFLIVVFAFAAFTIDFGYIVIVEQELQSAVDSATLAAAQELMQAELNPAANGNGNSRARGITAAAFEQTRDAAVDLAALNQVNGHPLSLDADNDVEFGTWDDVTRSFVVVEDPTTQTATAVRVTGRLGQANQTQVKLFFAPVLGHEIFEIESSAIAVIAQTKPRDVMLVIDRSGSMNDRNRLVYTKSAALQLLDELGEDDRVGLALYSVEVTEPATRLTGWLDQELHHDHQPTRARIPQLTADGRTNIAGGMRVAIEELIANKRLDDYGQPVQQIMVLMTDGMANETEPPGRNPVDSIYYYAELARSHDIIIHGITLGRGADEVSIRETARITGGEYHHVRDGDFEGLFEVYRGLGRGTDAPRLVR